jgi:hypothetical protein
MSRVPVVESPCPIVGKSLPAGATEHCAQCDRTVHNLDLMTARERQDFMASCSGKVCVAYTVRVPASGFRKRAATAAAIAAAALASLPIAAQEPVVEGASPVPDPNELPGCDDWEVITGGVAKGDEAKWTDDGKDAPPELPTIVDDGR